MAYVERGKAVFYIHIMMLPENQIGYWFERCHTYDQWLWIKAVKHDVIEGNENIVYLRNDGVLIDTDKFLEFLNDLITTNRKAYG